MLQKNSYEPKDARIMSYYEDDEIDDELADLGLLDSPRPGAATRKKKMTGTQALAEFLSTTSPEEFQKSQQGSISSSSRPTEPSSTNFFKLRKSSKRPLIPLRNNSKTMDLLHPSGMSSTSSSFSAPGAINRKNYIEIIPKVATTAKQQTMGDYQHVSSPVLPQMGYHKKRDSSLYSGSLRHSTSIRSQLSGVMVAGNGRMLGRQDTTTTLSTMASGYTNHKQKLDDEKVTKPVNNGLNEQQQRNLTHSVLTVMGNMDVIEAGLVQRLERCRIAGYDKPCDTVAHVLVKEHMRALDISFQQEHYNIQEQHPRTKSKARHMQVQTMNLDDPVQSITTTPSSPLSPILNEKLGQQMTVDQLEKQLMEEKKHRQRLQASLDETRDHFEVLSGLAYKKLREIWEEKLRWENTCIKLNEQLILNQQQQQQYHQAYDDIDELNSVIDKHNLSLSLVS